LFFPYFFVCVGITGTALIRRLMSDMTCAGALCWDGPGRQTDMFIHPLWKLVAKRWRLIIFFAAFLALLLPIDPQRGERCPSLPRCTGRSGHKGSQRTGILRRKWHQAPDSGASESGGGHLKD
jgi:hypothetical protein